MNFGLFVLILHYILIILLGGLSVSGAVDGIFGDAPWVGMAGSIIPSLALFLLVVFAIINPTKKLATYAFLWIAGLAFFCSALSPAASQHELFLPVLFVITVLLSSLVRKEPVWIPVSAYILIFGLVRYSVGIQAWSLPDFGLSKVAGELPFSAILLGVGLVPWGILKKKNLILENEMQQMVEEARSNALVDAVTKTRLAMEAEKRSTEHLSKTAVFRTDASSTDTFIVSKEEGINEQLNCMVYFMSRNFKAFTAAAFIYDSKRHTLVLNCYHSKSLYMVDKAEIPYGEGAVGRVISENRLFMSGDLSLYDAGLTYYSQRESVNSVLAVPVASETGEVLGALVIDSRDKNAFREQDKELMRRFSTIAAALITNIRMSNIQEQAAKTFKIFYEASHKFTNALKLEDVFEVLFQVVPQITTCTRVISILYDETKNSCKITRVAGAKFDASEGMEFPLNSGLYSFAFLKKKVVHIPDILAHGTKYYRFVPNEGLNPSLKSLIIFPIISDSDKKCIGLFSIESSEPSQFTAEIQQVLTTLVENASVAFTRSLLYQRMEKLATTDGLTELNNHRTFQEFLARELERARRYSRPLALLLMDIDHFKSFNDTYGHPVGDLVLKEIAGCIRASVRVNDIPARYGGEEFAVIIPESGDQGAVAIAQRIRQSIESHVIKSGENNLHVTVSIGCAVFPFHGQSQQQLIDSSDKALYFAKKHGRNQVILFRPDMTEQEK